MAGGKLVLLEPRRLAARGAAERMAKTLGETVGETVGLRVRLGSKVSSRTRIEVVTEGVFSRMILDDPSLGGIAAVLFDEFHERSLDADFGLALALDAQAALREDLRILVMSATLDGARVAALLNDAPVIESHGRAYSIETRYLGRDPSQRIEEQTTTAILQACREEKGSLLVFLPGQGEILRVTEALRGKITDPTIVVCPLYGALSQQEQDRAVTPAEPGRRKIVIATAIAETSLTINGVRVVVDSGLSRVPVYEPGIGLTRLKTVRVSRASADQRRGRAGRTEPGVCYRLWEAAANGSLEPFSAPEIAAADLSSLLLDCAAWGTRDPGVLSFLDPPPKAAINEARTLLQSLGAIEDDGAITSLGKRLRALPLPVRLARVVIEAADRGAAQKAADLVAVLVERGLGGDSTDLAHRVERFRHDRSHRAQDMRRLAVNWAKTAAAGITSAKKGSDEPEWGVLLALAYPDRIAKARGKPGDYTMANGRGGTLEPHDALSRQPFLVIAELAGAAASARILAACALDVDDLAAACGEALKESTEIAYDSVAKALRARAMRRYGALVLSERPLPVPASEEAAKILVRGLASSGLSALPWSKSAVQWRDRVMAMRRAEGAEWPDVSDAALLATIEEWLAPHLIGKASANAIDAAEVSEALRALLPWTLQRRLDHDAPTHFEVPTGSLIPIDYSGEDGPVLAVRVQELFGLASHPSIAHGRTPLILHLLSPAHRPIQITRDLPGFWRGSWGAVKADMRGRYPKHPWPDDPLAAPPTRRAKPRGI